MKILNAEVQNNILKFDDVNAGNAFDHKVTQISILVPSEYRGSNYIYQLMFQTEEQKKNETAFITAAGFLTINSDGRIIYALPQAVMRTGDLSVQLRIFDNSLNNLINMSNAVLKVGETLPGGNQIIDDQYAGLLEAEYQKKLISGNNISISEDNVIDADVNDFSVVTATANGENDLYVEEPPTNMFRDPGFENGIMMSLMPKSLPTGDTIQNVVFKNSSGSDDICKFCYFSSEDGLVEGVPKSFLEVNMPVNMFVYVLVSGAQRVITKRAILISTKITDLNNYVKATDYATNEKAGILKVGDGLTVNSSDGTVKANVMDVLGIKINDSNKSLEIVPATDQEIENPLLIGSNFKPIVPANLVKAVTVGGEGVFVKESELDSLLDGYVKSTDYVGLDKGGIVRVTSEYGISERDGYLRTLKATDAEIEAKGSSFKPIVPANLVKAVTVGGEGVFVKEQTLELIEEITVTEDNVNTITRNLYPNGQAYNLDGLKVMLNMAAGDASIQTQYVITYADGSTLMGLHNGGINTGVRYSALEAYKRNGVWVTDYVGPTSYDNVNAGGTVTRHAALLGADASNKITGIEFRVPSANAFPLGSIIKIYGVKV